MAREQRLETRSSDGQVLLEFDRCAQAAAATLRNDLESAANYRERMI